MLTFAYCWFAVQELKYLVLTAILDVAILGAIGYIIYEIWLEEGENWP